MTKRPHQEGRFIHLDMVRGIAALVVCLGHLRHNQFIDYSVIEPKPSFSGKVFYFLTSQGHAAVMIFFVLSGFFIAGSIATDFEKKSWSWARYGIRRLTRLYVVLIPALFLTLFWDKCGSSLSTTSESVNHGVLAFGGTLLFVQNLLTPFFGSNYPLWSVAYEFWYYLMFPLLFACLTLGTRIGERLLTLSLFVVCLVLLPHRVLMGGVVWLAGYGAFVLFHHPRLSGYVSNAVVFSLSMLALILNILMSGMPNGVSVPGDFTEINFSDVITGLCFGLMVPFLAKHEPKMAWYCVLAVGLSDISYTLYAVHLPLMKFFACTFFQFKGSAPSLASYAAFTGYSVLLLLYAAGVWWLFESRTAKVRKFFEGRFLKPRKKTVAQE